MEYNKLSTGETYKLADLFSKDNKIAKTDMLNPIRIPKILVALLQKVFTSG